MPVSRPCKLVVSTGNVATTSVFFMYSQLRSGVCHVKQNDIRLQANYTGVLFGGAHIRLHFLLLFAAKDLHWSSHGEIESTKLNSLLLFQ